MRRSATTVSPRRGIRVHKRSGLARGLIFAFLPHAGPVNVVNGMRATSGSNYFLRGMAGGHPAMVGDPSVPPDLNFPIIPIAVNQSFSMAGTGIVNEGPQEIIAFRGGLSGSDAYLGVSWPGEVWWSNFRPISAQVQVTASSIPLVKDPFVAVGLNDLYTPIQALYTRGKTTGSSAVDSTTTAIAEGNNRIFDTVRVMANVDGSGGHQVGTCAAWDRVLSIVEVYDYLRNPLSLFTYDRQIYIPVSAAAPTANTNFFMLF